MNPSLAIVPVADAVSRPDISWMKKHVPIMGVARALGLTVRHRKAKCWRAEKHRHGDASPSLSFFEKRNRCRCFVCDMRGGHSNIDLVMGVLGCDLPAAVRWIAERFSVPNIKVGRPEGSALMSPSPYRVGVSGSEWEVVVRSGMWGRMTHAEQAILFTLDNWKDADSGLTRMSYGGLMRFAGVGKRGNVAAAIKELARMHALQVSRGQRIGITRECSTYRVTLDNPKFLELCNAVFLDARKEISQEREYRASQKRERERTARRPNASSLQSIEGGLRPPVPPGVCVSDSDSKAQNQPQETPTCEGLNLSSPREPHANLSVPPGNREISAAVLAKLERDKATLRARGLL